MKHDFSKPAHVTSAEENMQKKRLPVYMLVAVGLFLVALLIYMFVERNPSPREAPPDQTAMQPATMNNMNNSAPKVSEQDAVATDNAKTAANR
ncbi:hypothetical protein [Acinetobacter sp. CAAS 2-6]|uniref:hypothetical protein n=1 Tax=Acinetobacter sp. CAAS 2-6 TaxID=3016358 RepID=UPI002DD666BA|nr:hypothetical protein [Acinetobacter sp. CAAS 2-6]